MSRRSRKKKTFKKRRKKVLKKSKSLKKQALTKDIDGNLLIKVSDKWSKQALVNKAKYKSKYNLSIKDNEKFWKKEGKRISWIKPYTKIKEKK